MDLVRIIFAILLPPVGVFLQVGIGGHFWLNILLTILGYIPGIVHAVCVAATQIATGNVVTFIETRRDELPSWTRDGSINASRLSLSGGVTSSISSVSSAPDPPG